MTFSVKKKKNNCMYINKYLKTEELVEIRNSREMSGHFLKTDITSVDSRKKKDRLLVSKKDH